MILLFKVNPKHNTEVLSCVPKCKKAVMSSTEEIRVLDKLPVGMCYSVVGWYMRPLAVLK